MKNHFADMKDDLPFEPGSERKARSRAADETELPVEEMRGQLRDATALTRFIEAGRAVLTVRSRKTGARFTLRLAKPDDKRDGRVRIGKPPPIFVNVLSGADNTSDYTYLGCLWRKPWGYDYAHGRNSRVAVDAPSVLAVRWLVKLLNNAPEKIFEQAEFWHEGRCGRCGRRLTVPESVETGFGPECAGKVGL